MRKHSRPPPPAPPAGHIPMHTFSTSPVVPGERDGEFKGTQLPLNLIALIITYVEDASDLARMTRACRVLHYMTLPRLYESVTLHSYDEIRYVDGRPEGFGGGSPFAMALNGLITRNVTNYVKRFRLWGEWKEADLQHLAKGRIPDSSLLLNVAVRAALDKMPILESFSWELNTKPLKTVYDSLVARPALRFLTIRFPDTRMPRPTIIIPPMPHLRSFIALDIDPLCYPDDMSVLFLHSKRLESVTLHFHPRIRENAEPSVTIDAFFGRCLAAKQRLALRHLAFHNLYAARTKEVNDLFDENKLESLTLLNCGGSCEGDPRTIYLDDTWRVCAPQKHPPNMRQLRLDFVDKLFTYMFPELPSLERLYIVSARRKVGGGLLEGSGGGDVGSTHASPVTPGQTPPGRSPEALAAASLVTPYLNSITQQSGHSLKHLLLSHHWTLGADEIGQLVRGCPNLTQLGISLHENNFTLMRLLLPFLRKLYACRLLMNPADPGFVQKLEALDAEEHELAMGYDLVGNHFDTLKWVGVGRLNFEIGREFLESITNEDDMEIDKRRRTVRCVGHDAVKDVAIWKMDSQDIVQYQPIKSAR